MIESEGTEIVAEMYRVGIEDILKSRCDLFIMWMSDWVSIIDRCKVI